MKYEAKKDSEYLKFSGRILYRDNEAILGYTNSYMELKVKGTAVDVNFRTGNNEEVNQPGLKVYVDGELTDEIVLTREKDKIRIYNGEKDEVHRVKLIKITEAAMSFVAVSDIEVEGELISLEDEVDERTKVEFIGDSITCGYGVLGEPDSEYTVREEDGELSYAGVLAKKMDWNARWASVSGYGMFVEYTGDPENIVPKVYAYTNWFYDNEERLDYSEFEPDYIFVNLGTNDSGHLGDPNILGGFKSRYESFLYTLRMAHKESTIICILGTLAPGVYKYVQEVIDKVKNQGFEKLYGLELPEHNVELDGMASGHPSPATHIKDADRIIEFMKQEGMA